MTKIEKQIAPLDWIKTDIGTFAPLQRGFDLPNRERIDGKYPVVYSNGVMNYHNKSQVKGPGVVTGRSGTIGKVHYVEDDYWPHNTALWVKEFNNATPKFVYYFYSYIGFERFSSGSGVPTLNRNDAHSFAICVPSKQSEQTAIANALSDVDALIQELEKLIAKKQAIKTATMQQLLTGRTRLPQFAHHHDGRKKGYKPSELGEIPEDWEVFNFFDKVDIAQGQVSPRIEPYSSMILVGPKHVESGTGKLIFSETAKEQGAISGKYQFLKGDVLYGKINPYLMKATLAEYDGLCSADMYPLRPKESLSAGFLLAIILGESFTKYAIAVSARSGMPKINRKEFSEFKFFAPTIKDEQESIAAILSDIDKDIQSLDIRLSKTRQIKQGMMQELLTGKTRLVKPAEPA
ncbi:restriction endonuclease subunit S [Vibrio cholerae]|uniref:restriction endonuclease subunit S n=1 Tax=Vibrio cholerae TaxID=666 RepID=UPI0011D8BDDD|nr:restriction endonuclease subunit S [Vibrio cholerae]ELJ8563972.1 restriction endonuclease subunit S [Vibrio cholerae]MDV2379628.1 restriction endonuclease subunit S [Vibrio cholerae]TXY28151.1 restriction endonuclease subunit S [Vibrio cholerae]GHX84764.1 restriction endonuclease subunit S [Vibrio cholerae]